MKTLAAILCLALLALPIGLVPELMRSHGFVPWGPPGVAGGRGTDGHERGARERYAAALATDTLVGAAVHDAWLDEAAAALDAPLAVTLPHAEGLMFDGAASRASAAAFTVALAPPEVLHLVTASGEGAVGGLLVDVLAHGGAGAVRVAAFGGAAPDGVAAGPAPLEVRWAPPAAGDYVVRVQPTLGASGAFGIALARRPPLDFPVATDSANAVRSFFGDVRDGGRRDHHGIDIFAPRGTPVLAAADGIVARVGNSARGGLHVWQRARADDGGRLGSFYYAHLDGVEVLTGDRVRRGERLGTVGNTGNARSTPPHLHFGLYRRPAGPIDPLPLVGDRRTASPEVPLGHALAPWLAVASASLNLRLGPGTAYAPLGRLPGGALVRVLGVSGDWARVQAWVPGADEVEGGAGGEAGSGARAGMPRVGFVAHALLDVPAGRGESLGRERALRGAPATDAPRLATLAAGTGVTVVGAFGPWRRITTATGAVGWVDSGTEPPVDGALPDG